jgi:shikimate kinase
MPDRIFILGFMGSGKTYLGRRLASALGFLFIDLDEVIVQQEAQSITQIFDNKGETYFRNAEANTLRQMASVDRVVVSCGGGTPCFHENMSWMNAHGLTLWLNPPLELMRNRLQRKPEKRPLLKGLGSDEEAWDNFIEDKMKGRLPYYRAAAIEYVQQSESDNNVAEVLSLIKNHLSCTPT